MRHIRFSLLVCAVAVAPLLGCDDGADQAANESTATSCAIESFDTAWWNQSFPEQTGKFHVEFSVDVSAPNMDFVVGLSNGAAAKWSSLAAIVRFNAQGYVDARDGGTYRADKAYPYYASSSYQIRLDVDVRTHRYSVWAKPSGWPVYEAIARDYAFRTEQASVTKLTNVAGFINPDTSANGSANICGFVEVTDDTTANGCMTSNAGRGFANAVITSSNNVSLVAFSAQVSDSNMDGVVGVTSGNADAYDDYAASIRFYTNGLIEARDGDQYRADSQVRYVTGQSYTFRMYVDLASHTYSVYVSGPGVASGDAYGTPEVMLASNYRFRPAQAGVTTLDRVAMIVASASGRVDACGIAGGPHAGLIAIRAGSYDLWSLANGSVLISASNKTTLLDANNAPVAAVDVGGQVAADDAGNIYVATSADGDLHVWAYTSTLSPRWSTGSVVDGRLVDIAVTSGNEVALVFKGTGEYDWKPVSLARHGQTGQFTMTSLPAGTMAVGLGRDRYVVAREQEGGYNFEAYAYGGTTPLGSRRIDGGYDVTKVAVAPDGSFVITGHLRAAMNFGDGEITIFAPNPDSGVYWDQYVASFAADFTTRHSARMTNEVYGLATNGRYTAVSYQTWTQIHYADVVVFDATAAFGGTTSEDAYISHYGTPGPVAVSMAGRAYWNLSAPLDGQMWSTHFPFLLTLAP
jgi:hypothetical protein